MRRWPIGFPVPADDQVADVRSDRWTAGLVRVSQLLAQEPVVPGRQRGRGEDAVLSQFGRGQTGQRGQDRAVSPRWPWPADLTAQHETSWRSTRSSTASTLLRRPSSASCPKPDHGQIQQSKDHQRRSWRTAREPAKPQVVGLRRVLARYRACRPSSPRAVWVPPGSSPSAGARPARSWPAMDERRAVKSLVRVGTVGRRHSVEIQPKQPSIDGPAEMFTGDVWARCHRQGEEPSRMRVNLVRFALCARTAWHCHAVGQTLHVTEGIGLVQSRGGEVIEMRAGETIYTRPGEWHWHGGAPDRFMTHLAMWEDPEKAKARRPSGETTSPTRNTTPAEHRSWPIQPLDGHGEQEVSPQARPYHVGVEQRGEHRAIVSGHRPGVRPARACGGFLCRTVGGHGAPGMLGSPAHRRSAAPSPDPRRVRSASQRASSPPGAAATATAGDAASQRAAAFCQPTRPAPRRPRRAHSQIFAGRMAG
jgi:quercetin dioxygenase-like cupin family protein